MDYDEEDLDDDDLHEHELEYFRQDVLQNIARRAYCDMGPIEAGLIDNITLKGWDRRGYYETVYQLIHFAETYLDKNPTKKIRLTLGNQCWNEVRPFSPQDASALSGSNTSYATSETKASFSTHDRMMLLRCEARPIDVHRGEAREECVTRRDPSVLFLEILNEKCSHPDGHERVDVLRTSIFVLGERGYLDAEINPAESFSRGDPRNIAVFILGRDLQDVRHTPKVLQGQSTACISSPSTNIKSLSGDCAATRPSTCEQFIQPVAVPK